MKKSTNFVISCGCGKGTLPREIFKARLRNWLGHPLFFLRLPSNAFPDIGSVDRIEKKKTKKQIVRSLGIVGPGTPRRR